jgi:hypothetical protein
MLGNVLTWDRVGVKGNGKTELLMGQVEVGAGSWQALTGSWAILLPAMIGAVLLNTQGDFF